MSVENGSRPNIESPQNHETRGDSKLAFLLATVICVSAGLTGLSIGNPGGYVALGMGALSAIGAIRS